MKMASTLSKRFTNFMPSSYPSKKQVVLMASAVSDESVMIVTLDRLFLQGRPVFGLRIWWYSFPFFSKKRW